MRDEKPNVRGDGSQSSAAKNVSGDIALSLAKLNAVLAVLLATATIVLYSPVLRYSFLAWDDPDYVTNNWQVSHGLAWSTFKWAFTSTHAENWHPLTWLSHALDCQLFALNPMGHHLDSVLIHSVNAALLFLLLVWMTDRVEPSFLVAALFAVHPLNVESVAWVAERKNVLSTLCVFLAIGAYVWYVRKANWRRYLLVVSLYAAGLMAKPMVITLPFVLLLLDYWPLERMKLDENDRGSLIEDGAQKLEFWRLLLEKVPLLILTVASASITLKSQRPAESTFEAFPLSLRVENAVVAYGSYLWKMLWPTRLSAFYPYPPAFYPIWQLASSALILVGVTVLVIFYRRNRYLPVGWFWYLGTLVPVIGLVQVGEAAMADRYAYLPLIGIFVILAWALDGLAQARKIRTAWRVVPSLFVLLALAVTTARQMSAWENEYALWAHTLLVTKQNPVAQASLADALLNPEVAITNKKLPGLNTEQDRIAGARQHYEYALQLYRPLAQHNPSAYLPHVAMVLNNLGNVARIQNRTDDAKNNYEEALKVYRHLAQQAPEKHLPELAGTLTNLGNMASLQNRMDEASECYDEALKIYSQLAQQDPDKYLPDLARTLDNLGAVDKLGNRLDEASERYDEALNTYRELARQNPEVYLPEMASTALKLGPLATNLSALANQARAENRMDNAREHYEAALRLYRQLAQEDPDLSLPRLAETLMSLGLVDQLQGRFVESRACYTEAMTIYRRLAQVDPFRYSANLAHVEAILRDLDSRTSRH